MKQKPTWWIYKGNSGKTINDLPDPPPWRRFTDEAKKNKGKRFEPNSEHEIEMVNAALYLRRPLLVTGKPGIGKTSLAYSAADDLKLGNVLRWSVTTRSTLQESLYRYDAIARLQDASLQEKKGKDGENGENGEKKDLPDISRYLRLGPLGTAFAAKGRPRVLLIDEIDKSDIDLPNDLLHIFEEGEFEIPELARLPDDQAYKEIPDEEGQNVGIEKGKVRCEVFPLVIMTSNAERDFPPAFLRRCLQLDMKLPKDEKAHLARIAALHLENTDPVQVRHLIEQFLQKRDDDNRELSTDQLLNAVYFAMNQIDPLARDKEGLGEDLLDALWKSLTDSGKA